jgi:hypothetical protein
MSEEVGQGLGAGVVRRGYLGVLVGPALRARAKATGAPDLKSFPPLPPTAPIPPHPPPSPLPPPRCARCWRRSGAPRGWAARRWAPTSSPWPRPRPTCWRWSCCRRRRACRWGLNEGGESTEGHKGGGTSRDKGRWAVACSLGGAAAGMMLLRCALVRPYKAHTTPPHTQNRSRPRRACRPTRRARCALCRCLRRSTTSMPRAR